jgi:ADP-heptose:LPS heptosyltransferase
MPKKLLIIRFSSIGDIVLTSPVVRCISQQLKDVEVHYLTKDRYAPIVANNPYISKVYSIKKSVTEVIRDLRRENYDYIIDLHKNLRTGQVLAGLMKPFSSFNKLNIEKWLMVRFKVNKLPPVHIVDRYIDTVRSLGVMPDNGGLDFFIPESQEVELTGNLSGLNKGYVAIVVGGNHNTKILPPEIVIQIINELKLNAILLGGNEDKSRGDYIEQESAGRAINLCGKYNLMGSASLVRQSKAILTNDTGLMHIAAAFRKPMATVWGNTIPEFGMYPYVLDDTPVLISEVKDLKCRPCSKLGYPECPLKHFKCMRDQNWRCIAEFLNDVTS